MTKVFFSTEFLLGLYLTLPQIQLSIDRASEKEWEKLCDFLDQKTKTQAILDKLKSSRSSKRYPLSRFGYLTTQELEMVISAMENYAYLRSKTICTQPTILIDTRIELTQVEELVRNRISKPNLLNKQNIEHLNQNEILRCQSINDLVGNTWLNPEP